MELILSKQIYCLLGDQRSTVVVLALLFKTILHLKKGLLARGFSELRGTMS